MSRSGRRPWETPITYEEDRFPDQQGEAGGTSHADLKPDPDLDLNRVNKAQPIRKPAKPIPLSDGPHDRLVRNADRPDDVGKNGPGKRPSWRDAGGGRSIDDKPLNYGRGPHTGELDVDDRDDPNYD